MKRILCVLVLALFCGAFLGCPADNKAKKNAAKNGNKAANAPAANAPANK